MRDFLLICLAGAAGTGSRFLVSSAAVKMFGKDFPVGTLAVNLIGCLVIGLLMEVALESQLVHKDVQSVLAIGFLGAFTTYATFGYETFRFVADGDWMMASANVVVHIVVGLLAIGLGVGLGRLVLGGM